MGWVPVFAYCFVSLFLLNENPEVFPLSRSKTRLRPGAGGIVPRFGAAVEKLTPQNPARARLLFLTGLRAQAARLAIAPDRRLGKARQYAARVSMDAIIRPLSRGGNSAIVNVFFPCELLQAFGIHPLFAEGLSCYLNGAWAEKYYLRAAEEAGVSPNFCSYHKALLGAGLTGLIPKPDFTACTSLACDANNLTFRRLAQHYDIPCFYVDVPYTRDEDAVREVAVRLRQFADFLSDRTGRPLDEDALKAAVARSGRTLDTLHKAHRLLAGKEPASDVVSESYEVFLTHILLGTPEAEHYADLLLADAQAAPENNGLRIVWGHTIPFYQAPVKELFDFSDKAHLAACEIGADCYGLTMDPEHPFESMAQRLVYNSYNGGARHRIDRLLELCREQQADGLVYFCHWGCKGTQGAAQLVRTRLEEAGFPVLLLDGDGCDRANGSDGQTSTRLGAFLEMLEANRAKAAEQEADQ